MLATVFGLVVSATLVGCTSNAAPDHEQIAQEWREKGDSSLSHYPDANDAQKQVLKRSLASGEVTYADYKDRMMAYVGCLEEALTEQIAYDENSKQFGLPIIEVSIVSPDEEHEVSEDEDRLRLHCYATEVSLVNDLYLSQPSATEAYFATAEEFRDALVACLQDANVAVDAKAPIADILNADAEASATQNGEPRNPCTITTGLGAALSAPGDTPT